MNDCERRLRAAAAVNKAATKRRPGRGRSRGLRTVSAVYTKLHSRYLHVIAFFFCPVRQFITTYLFIFLERIIKYFTSAAMKT